MTEISGSRVRELKSRAHHLKPVVMVGQKGITESLLEAMNKALDDHELIKVKFIEFKEDRRELSRELEEKTGSALVDIIGNMAIFYREKDENEE